MSVTSKERKTTREYIRITFVPCDRSHLPSFSTTHCAWSKSSLALHDMFFFFRRVLLGQVTQTLFTDAATVVLVVYDIGTPTEIRQP